MSFGFIPAMMPRLSNKFWGQFTYLQRNEIPGNSLLLMR